ncbi:MAG: elongation factor G [Pirellulaceae bacterium]|nr:elongation factor G [Pirellulaceae bacterium]
MSKYTVDQIRNIVLVGHGAAGKTSLADQMLFYGGVSKRVGSVDDGTSMLDTDQEAKEHHFSIAASVCHFEHHGFRVNVVDTPGYPDFVGQVISAICAAETAIVVINASSGIELNTRRTFDLAGKAHLARIIVLNKLDRDNVDFAALVGQIQETFGRPCIPLNVPNATGSGFNSVVTTLNRGATNGTHASVDADQWGAALMDAIVETDEAMMECYLDGQEIPAPKILAGIHNAIAAGTLVPILCTCAKSGIGVPELMDAIADFGLEPGELVRHAQSASGEDHTVTPTSEAPFVAQVFKTKIDPYVSKLSFIRILSGKLTKDTVVRDARSGRGVKIHQLLDVQGGQIEQVDEAHAGDLVAVAKIDDFQVGDTLFSSQDSSDWSLPSLEFPTPIIGLAVEPRTRDDQPKIATALHRIEEEDPTFRIVRDPQTHEMVMQGMSDLHLKIVQERMKSRDKVDVVTHEPKVAYRETCHGTAEGSYRHKKQSGGSGQFGEVHMRIHPVPSGIDPVDFVTKDRFEHLREYRHHPEFNFIFVDCVSGGTVPNQFIPAVEKGVLEKMEQGILAGYPIQDVAVELFYGKHHPVDSNEAAFRIAARQCLRQMFMAARPGLLEPIVHLEVTIPADYVGAVSGDLSSRRGRMEGMDSLAGGLTLMKSRVPLSEISSYARVLSGMTGGQGSFTIQFSHYEQLPPHEQQKIVADSHVKHDDE